MSPIIVVFVIAAVFLAIWGGIVSAKKAKERKLALRAYVRQLGFRFSEGNNRTFSKQLEGPFPTLRQGDNRYAYNIAEGKVDGGESGELHLFLFDHHHETTSTDSDGDTTTHHHHRSFVLFDHGVNLGVLDLRPEGFFDKIKGVFGFDDIDFESAAFSKRYHVKSEDRELAYAIFHPKMIEFMMRIQKIKMTTAGPLLLLTRGHGTMSVPEYRRVVRDGRRFLDRIPRYLRKDRALP